MNIDDIYEQAHFLSQNKEKRKIFAISLGIIYLFDIILYVLNKNLVKVYPLINIFAILVSVCTYPFLLAIIRSFFPFKEKIIENEISTDSSKIIEDAIKKYFSESFVDQNDIVTRAKQVSAYLINAGIIISELQKEMEEKKETLENLLSIIETRKQDAEYYMQLAALNEQLVVPLRKEIEKGVRNELEREDKRKRLINIVMWIITLFAGGIVGVLFQKWFG